LEQIPLASEPTIGRGTALRDPNIRRTGLGLGCAGLMRLASRRQRQRLLGEAHAQGLSHFDVARMYGLGMAESELGRFARGRREQITIATKFGIEPGSPRLARLQAPARAAAVRLPSLRAALKRRGPGSHPPRRYDAASARASLETSLRELGTDYVDVFFVHDPAPTDHVDLDGLGELCEELIESGKIRAWGLSGDPDPCIELSCGAPGSVLQVHDEIFEPFQAPLGEAPRTITFGVLSSALSKIQGHLSASAGRRSRWRSEVGQDCGNAEVLASLLLQDAIDRNRDGTVLFGTTRPERIRLAVAAADPAMHDRDSLRAFRDCVRRDFRDDGGRRG
jgi:aryl-alcohol dehydrogenase-like predicted oxidoreductase